MVLTVVLDAADECLHWAKGAVPTQAMGDNLTFYPIFLRGESKGDGGDTVQLRVGGCVPWQEAIENVQLEVL